MLKENDTFKNINRTPLEQLHAFLEILFLQNLNNQLIPENIWKAQAEVNFQAGSKLWVPKVGEILNISKLDRFIYMQLFYILTNIIIFILNISSFILPIQHLRLKSSKRKRYREYIISLYGFLLHSLFLYLKFPFPIIKCGWSKTLSCIVCLFENVRLTLDINY